jgi:hypothetical protein
MKVIGVFKLGEGPYLALDTSKVDKEGECPVVAWAPGFTDDQELEVIANDYGEFVLQTLKSALQALG